MARTTHELPFPGMRPFREDEWDLFFGQEDSIEALQEQLGESRFIAVMGESGCGKSSIVKAGLIPSQVGRARSSSSASSPWHVSVSRPAKAPIRNLATALIAAGLAPQVDEANVVATLNAHSHGLLETLSEARVSRERRILIVVDQFEELFRFQRTEGFAERDEAALFVKLVLAAVREPSVPVYVILTMRSEYLGDCANFFGLAEAVNKSSYLLPNMNRLQLESAIVEPLREFDCIIENKLLQHLLNETESAREDGLPMLQHALRQTWKNRAAFKDEFLPLAMDHFLPDQDAGGKLDIEKHLNRHLDEIYGELKEEKHEGTTAAIFKLLGQFDHKGRLIRRPTDFSKIRLSTGATEFELLAVINRFRDEDSGRSFLMPPKSKTRQLLDGTEPLDISHEALLRRWLTCNEWLAEEARDAETYRDLASQANRAGSDPLTGRLLDAAWKWWSDFHPAEGWAERYNQGRFSFTDTKNFLELSLAARKKDQLRERLSVRRLRWMLATIGVLLIAAIGFGWYAWTQKENADFSALLLSIALARADRAEQQTTNEKNQALAAQKEMEAVQASARAARFEAAGNAQKADQARKEAAQLHAQIDQLRTTGAPAEGSKNQVQTGAQSASPDAKEFSGPQWVTRFPESRSMDDFSEPFRTGVKRFVTALQAAGARVDVAAMTRPPQRAYLMYYAYQIARKGLDPNSVPAMAGVAIEWTHTDAQGKPDLNESRAAAQQMVTGYGIVFQPALTSRYTQGRAIAMGIEWRADLTITDGNGTEVQITSFPRTGSNQDLQIVGATYGVIKVVGSHIDWSSDGH